MEQRLDCNIVRDLLPNYAERMTSKETDKKIEEHLDTCRECSGIYHEMMEDIHVESAPEIKNFKKYLGWTQLKYISWGLLFLGLIGIFVSVLVNFIIDKSLTWSLIVTGGVVYTYAVGFTFLKADNHKLIKTLLCASILLMPLLFVIQGGMSFMGMEEEWFVSMGIPIGILWVAILWVTVLIQKIFKLNIWYTLAVLLMFSLPGNIITNAKVSLFENGVNKFTGGFGAAAQIFSGFSTVVMAVVLIMVGIWYNKKKKGGSSFNKK